MKDGGEQIKPMVKEDLFMQMAISMTATGKTTKLMDLVFTAI